MERDPEAGLSGIQDEVCNGFDDDCNGAVDDVQPESCSVDNKKGECANGQTDCPMGQEVCKQVNFPKAEICNGKDDNCNGLIDDNATCAFGFCQSGMCFCPHVFSHDGNGFRYETTVGGVSLIGRKEHIAEGRESFPGQRAERNDEGRHGAPLKQAGRRGADDSRRRLG